MGRRCDDLFATDKHMNQFICLVNACLNNFLECYIPGFLSYAQT